MNLEMMDILNSRVMVYLFWGTNTLYRAYQSRHVFSDGL